MKVVPMVQARHYCMRHSLSSNRNTRLAYSALTVTQSRAEPRTLFEPRNPRSSTLVHFNCRKNAEDGKVRSPSDQMALIYSGWKHVSVRPTLSWPMSLKCRFKIENMCLQYLVYHPSACITAATLLTIVSTNFVNSSSGIAFHVAIAHSTNRSSEACVLEIPINSGCVL